MSNKRIKKNAGTSFSGVDSPAISQVVNSLFRGLGGDSSICWCEKWLGPYAFPGPCGWKSVRQCFSALAAGNGR